MSLNTRQQIMTDVHVIQPLAPSGVARNIVEIPENFVVVLVGLMQVLFEGISGQLAGDVFTSTSPTEQA